MRSFGVTSSLLAVLCQLRTVFSTPGPDQIALQSSVPPPEFTYSTRHTLFKAQRDTTCDPDYYYCAKSGLCIHYTEPCQAGCPTGSWWCDVMHRCIDQEQRCAGQCDAGYWWCAVVHMCVPETDQCAGECHAGWTPTGHHGHCKQGCDGDEWWWCASRKLCIPVGDSCDGKCPGGWHAAGDECIPDVCASPSPGVSWYYYQLTLGSGPGQIPFTPQPAAQPFDLPLIMSGPSIPDPINGTADKAGWVDQGYLRQGTTGAGSLQVVRLSPDIPASASYFLMFWTGYLIPRTTGPYTFYGWWTDDAAALWVGDKALTPSATNYDMYIRYASQDYYGVKSYTVNAVAGKPIPYTVLNIQSAGPFSLCFAIKQGDRVVMNACGEAGDWPIATDEVVSCPHRAFRPVFT